MKHRNEFEAWMIACHGSCSLARDGRAKYIDATVRMMYSAWCAATIKERLLRATA